MSNCTCLNPDASGDIWCGSCKEYVDPWADHKRIAEMEAENAKWKEAAKAVVDARDALGRGAPHVNEYTQLVLDDMHAHKALAALVEGE